MQSERLMLLALTDGERTVKKLTLAEKQEKKQIKVEIAKTAESRRKYEVSEISTKKQKKHVFCRKKLKLLQKYEFSGKKAQLSKRSTKTHETTEISKKRLQDNNRNGPNANLNSRKTKISKTEAKEAGMQKKLRRKNQVRK